MDSQGSLHRSDRGGMNMKLIIAIVQDEDASHLISELMNEGFSVTKLATTGGFLRAGNTTLLVGVDEDKYDPCLEIIKKICKSRKQIATSPVTMGGATGMYAPYPIEVTVGGATVFVMSVDQFIKI
jgi:uncharacterized protein YaaQ